MCQRWPAIFWDGWPIFALHHSPGGCPVLAFFAGVGGDAGGAILVRSTLSVVYSVVVRALRRVREGRGTRSCGDRSLKAGATRPKRLEYTINVSHEAKE
jgi:hypothetical protein